MVQLEASPTVLEAALKLETRSMPALSSTLRAQLATACRDIGPDITAAFEGQQRVVWRALCAFVNQQVQEGILQPSATQPTTNWTRVWKWVLGALAFVFLVISERSRIRSSLHQVRGANSFDKGLISPAAPDALRNRTPMNSP
ncbi:MAG: hypothetical protein Q9173_000620 [Seirophora scorigena]